MYVTATSLTAPVSARTDAWEGVCKAHHDAPGNVMPPEIEEMGDVLCLKPVFNYAYSLASQMPSTMIHGDLSK